MDLETQEQERVKAVKIVYKPIDPKYYKELKSALYDLILKEVVGEDECPTGTVKLVGVPAFQRDRLRAEQRNKLKELFDETTL